MIFNNETLRTAVKDWLSDSVASEAKYGHISNWDTSQVTDMGNLFCNSNFNQPIGDWDVTNVTEMRNMFSNSTFNQPIGGWDVSNVTDMGNMFSNSTFNQPIGDWDVTNVTDMSNMFSNSAFNQWIGDWDISNVSDMNSMFSNNQNFNQNISKWEVSSSTDINEMFYGAKKIKSFCKPGGVDVQIRSSAELRAAVNEWLIDRAASEAKYGHISNWDTSQVTDMSRLFSNVIDFNQPLNDWDVSNVNCMRYMFSGAKAFNQPLNDWDVSGVTNMSYMFNGATAFNQPLNDWDVSNVINMPFMFEGATAFNQPLSDWDVSNVINMRHMFDGATAFNQTLNGWNFRNDSDTLQLDEQLPDEIVISCESNDFFYENSDGDKCSFSAYLLICFYPDEYGDTEYEIRDLIFEEVGEVILTFKGKNREPHIITDYPEIIDEDQTYHTRDIEGEIYSVKEAVQFINSLKTVKFDSLPKADTDDFISSEYKDWCIDNFNRTK
jgi:surface protein